MKNEAVLIVGAVIIAAQIVLALLKGEPLDATLFQSLIVAVGAIFARSQVYSKSSVNAIVSDASSSHPVDPASVDGSAQQEGQLF